MNRFAAAALVASLAAGVLASSASAAPGRFAVGLTPEADQELVREAVEAATGAHAVIGLGSLDALVFAAPDPEAAVAAAAGLPGVSYAEISTGARSLAFTPADPLAGDQWYLPEIRAFDFWADPPLRPPVRVAVIDSGIDGNHPELKDQIAAARSFVATRAGVDTEGHGTVVAGEIAAALDDEGIAGLGIPVELLVAKVVTRDGSISIDAEARAIRWAVDRGAQVINLSLGGPRNPNRPWLDSYSRLEHAAVDYATRKGVVVVAAAGNCSYRCPERYANYPAALPHVIGVGATTHHASVPPFSNRDDAHLDLVAPGVDMLSTHPRNLAKQSCADVGYTSCAPGVVHDGPAGTSFAAPLVAATAALLYVEEPLLRPHASQVTALVEGSARDLGAAGHDRVSGSGLLDVSRALNRLGAGLPARDRLEPNDGTGTRARPVRGRSRTIDATLTRYEDPLDVYRIRLRRGERVELVLRSPAVAHAGLALWRPGTPAVGARRKWRAASATLSRGAWRLTYRVERGGRYFASVRGYGGAYRLSVAKRP